MEKVLEIYNQIHDIPLLFSIVVAVLLPFLVIVVGYILTLVAEASGVVLGIILDPMVSYAVINYAFFPGVMLHELSHALLAVLTGAKVTEVALFKKVDDSLGHVNFYNRGNKLLVALQNIFISSAPMFCGAGIVYGCFKLISIIPKGTLIWLKIILGYIGISMFFHMTMSTADIKVYIKGVPLFIVIIFIITVPLRLTGII